MANYSASTVKTLNPLEHMRKYPGMYIGSKDADGLQHLVKEIVSNSIDEYLNGACNQIIVQLNNDGSIYISDNGRGIPHGKHESGCSVLQACFGIANTGGKFDNATGESGYNTSGGEHGTGAKAVNALSKKLVVTTSNNGYTEIVEFSRGEKVNYAKEECDASKTGVSVQFFPDPEILEETTFDSERIKTMLQEFSFLCTGLEFVFNDLIHKETIKYYSKNGLLDFMNFLAKDKLIAQPFYYSKQDGKFQLEAIVGYTNSYSNVVKLYTNNIPQKKGTHLTGFKTAWTSSLNQFARSRNLLKEKDANLTGGDLEEGQILILNFKMIDPVFKGQNKEELSSTEGRSYVQRFTSEAIKENEKQYEKFFKAVFDKAVAARKARDAAKKARDAARNIKPREKGLKAKMAVSNKFIDCTDKNPKNRNLLIVEGLSAGSSAIEARNQKTDCIYMLRGKIISPLKNSVDKILANQEMHDLVSIMSGGFADSFDVDKVPFDKIVITSDQDSDGAAIELLLITFFYTYMRPLVEAGKLYRAVTPLYIARKGKTEEYFYSEEEYAAWSQNHSGYDILRAKGLGELNAIDLHKVCFEKQRFKRLTVSDAQKTADLLDILEGSAVAPRKKYIYDNANQLGFEFD
jgi:DNA gyrase subunit B